MIDSCFACERNPVLGSEIGVEVLAAELKPELWTYLWSNISKSYHYELKL